MSVISPFLGDEDAARRLLEHVRRLDLLEGDEVIVADNTRSGAVPADASPAMVIHAPGERSAFHARNAGATQARNEWLLFVDADCRPAADLLAAYFARPVDERCGILAGAVRPLEEQPGLIPAYARSREQLSETHHLASRPEWPFPAGITGNLMVRRAAWDEVGGFHEGLRAGADIDLCWRIQRAGWSLVHRPGARVEHAHVESMRALLRQASGHGAGMQWMNRRHPRSFARPPLGRQLARCAAGTLVWALALQLRRSLFKLIDAAWFLAYARGYHAASNRAPRRLDPDDPAAPQLVAIAAKWPQEAGDETARELEALVGSAGGVRVEAMSRADRAGPGQREIQALYAEDDPPLSRAGAVVWLVARHPIRVLRRRAAGAGLVAVAPPARRCLMTRARVVAVREGERNEARLLHEIVAAQSASTRWRSEPRADV